MLTKKRLIGHGCSFDIAMTVLMVSSSVEGELAYLFSSIGPVSNILISEIDESALILF
jgi:hypothetical protein